MTYYELFRAILLAFMVIVIILNLTAVRALNKARHEALQDSRRLANMAHHGLGVFRQDDGATWGVIRRGILLTTDEDLRAAIDKAIIELNTEEPTSWQTT